jgi:glutamyl-tRNA reductase
MRLKLLGCSHRSAPVSVRERLAFGPNQAKKAINDLRGQFPHLEVVLLSTCNRVELYTATDSGSAPTRRQVAEFLGRFHGFDPAELLGHIYDLGGRDSVRHLFMVASSLDSMVVGEPQISSQVKVAYQLASQKNATGPMTHAIFQAASRVARRVASETSLHERRVSIPSVAVADLGERIFKRFDNKATLLIGAGEMAEETLAYLQKQGAHDVAILSRNPQRSAALARRRNGRPSRWEFLPAELAAADLVISATGADEPVVTREQFARVEPLRRGRPLYIVDLAVPRDIDPTIADRPGVHLYTLDDLQSTCERNQKAREKELPKAMQIIEQETNRFMADLHFRAAGPVVTRLKQMWREPKEKELQRLFNKLPSLDEQAQREIRYSFDRLSNKVFHRPVQSLRIEARTGVPTTLIDALARLFRIGDG